MTSSVYLFSIAGEKNATMHDTSPNANVTKNNRVNAFEYAARIVVAAARRTCSLTPGIFSAAATSPAFRAVNRDTTDVAGRPALMIAGTTLCSVLWATLLLRMVEKMAAVTVSKMLYYLNDGATYSPTPKREQDISIGLIHVDKAVLTPKRDLMLP